MTITKYLSNGIPVVMEKMEPYRSASIGIYVKAGSAYETEKNNGISHVIEHMLFKGTKKRTAKDLANEMAKIGGNMNAYTSKEETCYYAKVLDEHLEEAIDILADMINHSILDEGELEKELGVILEEIDMYDDSPEDLAQELSGKISFHRHPLGYYISGEKATVRKLTKKDMIDYMSQYYTADKMVISIAGSFLEDEVFEQLEREFGQIIKGAKGCEVTVPAFHPIVEVIQKDIEQTHFCLAYEAVSYETRKQYPLSIMNNIMGGSMNSRLFQRIREDKGLVYALYSYASSYKQTGIFQIYGAMNPMQTKEVMDEISSAIEELRTSGITKEELEGTKEQIKAELLMGAESTQNVMSNNGKNQLLRGRVISIDETLETLYSIEVDEVNEYIKDYIKPGQCSLAVVGDIEPEEQKVIENSWSQRF